jgi:pilus assembly protein CpaB
MSQRRNTWLVLGLALVCGAAAAALAVNYLLTLPPRLVQAPSRQIAVAAKELPIGALVSAEDVRMVRWPEEALPAGYYGSVNDVVGRGLTTPLRANEPLIAGKLAGEGEGAGLPPLIPDGMRALSVSVSSVVAVAGFVLPGSRVDVLLTLQNDSEPETRVFLQNMTVLAANQSIVHDQEGKPQNVSIVTFLVDPDQAEKLTLATREGSIQLVLRNRVDVEEVTTRGAQRADLEGTARRRAPTRSVQVRAPAPRPETRETVVETYRGGVRTLSTFSEND